MAALSKSVSTAGIALFVAGSALAQTTANGPYYATPSWDQTLPRSTRLIVLSNFNSEAVLDRETGLVWTRTAAGASSDSGGAADLCARAFIGGRGGWRLPAIQELTSLVGPLTSAALIENDTYTQQLGSVVWSGTISNSFSLRYVLRKEPNFGYWQADLFGPALRAVWCVRSPSPGERIQ